jgi:hypothetical protein
MNNFNFTFVQLYRTIYLLVSGPIYRLHHHSALNIICFPVSKFTSEKAFRSLLLKLLGELISTYITFSWEHQAASMTLLFTSCLW